MSIELLTRGFFLRFQETVLWSTPRGMPWLSRVAPGARPERPRRRRVPAGAPWTSGAAGSRPPAAARPTAPAVAARRSGSLHAQTYFWGQLRSSRSVRVQVGPPPPGSARRRQRMTRPQFGHFMAAHTSRCCWTGCWRVSKPSPLHGCPQPDGPLNQHIDAANKTPTVMRLSAPTARSDSSAA